MILLLCWVGLARCRSLAPVYPLEAVNITEPFWDTKAPDFLQSLGYGFGGGAFRTDGECGQSVEQCCIGRGCFGADYGQEVDGQRKSVVVLVCV